MTQTETVQYYKLQSKLGGRGHKYIQYFITIPIDVAEMVPEGAVFEVELVEEGILLRFAGVTA